MKKILSVIMTLVLVLSLCACGASGQGGANTAGLQIGYAKQTISPDLATMGAVGLGGYSDAETRKATGYLDYIYATCIAMTEGEETVLLYTVDMTAVNMDVANKCRGKISDATGIAEDHIFFGATHTHSAPSSSVPTFLNFMVEATVTAAQKALEDRAPATVLSASATVDGMNFDRNYIRADGTYTGSNYGFTNQAPITEHSTKSDTELQLVKFDRADDKGDILLTNWQAHPCYASTISYTDISSDYIGVLRDKVEKETGMKVAHFQGASGNQNTDSRIDSEVHGMSMKQYGEKLAQAVIDGIASLKPVEGSGIKTSRVQFDCEYDHSYDNQVSKAQEAYDLWKKSDLSTGNLLAREYGFSSVYQCRAIIARASLPASAKLDLCAVKVGGMAFVTVPYEMFSDAGLAIKGGSPFDTTLICTGNNGYIPTAAAYDFHSYEADTSLFVKGSAEKLANQLVTMLKGLE